MSRTALIAGATGLVGQFLVRRLLSSGAYDKVKLLVRRPLPLDDARLQILLSDYTDLAVLGADLKADDVYCCLGTTIRKAGSQAAFERVDYQMVVDLARAARQHGARQFLVISAAGSALRSPSFYSRVKARMEQAVAALGYDSVHILRPSLLLGSRTESRPAESAAQALAPLLSPLLRGPLRKYRPIRAEEVATTMLQLALADSRGVRVHDLPLA